MGKLWYSLVSVVVMLSLASTSYGLVIGDFENGMGNWTATSEAKAGLSIGTIGATSGTHSLVIAPVLNGLSLAVQYNQVVDTAKFVTLTTNVTWVASEWAGDPGASAQLQLVAINSDGTPVSKQFVFTDPCNVAAPGTWDPNMGDQTRKLTCDIAVNDPNGANSVKFVFVTNMTGMTKAGNFYVDNVQVLTKQPKVIFVSFHGTDSPAASGAAGAGFTQAPDKGYTDLLKASGFNVVRYVTTGTPDVNMLNAADLVIVGRSIDSTNYQNASADTWNASITAPMIVTSGYALRSSRLGFTTGTTIPDTTGNIKLAAKDATHPIFAGVSLVNGTMANTYAGIVTYPTDGVTKAQGISVNTNPVSGKGKILAAVAPSTDPCVANDPTTNGMIIGEWQAGDTITHAGGAGTDVLAGRRLVFLTGSREASGVNSQTAGQFDLAADGAKLFINAVSYLIPATQPATNPVPTPGDPDIPLDSKLSWTAGALATQHEVYLSTNKADVVSGKALVGTVTTNSFNLKPLNLTVGMTYYWKIVETNGSVRWESEVWSFKTIDYVVVDNFETYATSNIAKTWIDGTKAVPGVPCGAVPAVDMLSTHSGNQSMSVVYDNTKIPFVTEVMRIFPGGQNWSPQNAGVTTLVLWFHGDPNNSYQPLYVKINGYQINWGGDIARITKSEWTQWNIQVSNLPVQISSIATLNIGLGSYQAQVIPPGMKSGRKGILYIDDIRLYRVAP